MENVKNEKQYHYGKMEGKYCIVTGANSGLGKETSLSLADLGAHVIMVCRSEEKGRKAKKDILEKIKDANVDLMFCNLSKFSEVRDFANAYMNKFSQLDVLINNAGVYHSKYKETEDGVVSMMSVNHYSPFLLTHLLIPSLKKSTPSRIINVNSGMHKMANLNKEDILGLKTWDKTGMKGYAMSKLVNLLSIYKIADNLKNSGVTLNAINPGMTKTNLPRHSFGAKVFWKLISPFIKSAEEGAKPIIYLATNPEVRNISGKYFEQYEQEESSEVSYNQELQELVYQNSLEVTNTSETAS
jgi:NAD(P)-dependent dehydrogenase (short-subunit alcohol dehydrogenase family)